MMLNLNLIILQMSHGKGKGYVLFFSMAFIGIPFLTLFSANIPICIIVYFLPGKIKKGGMGPFNIRGGRASFGRGICHKQQILIFVSVTTTNELLPENRLCMHGSQAFRNWQNEWKTVSLNIWDSSERVIL